MGQVPKLTYGIVGDGRVARHIANYFSLLDIPFKNWSRQNPTDNLADSTVILILISDSQIENYYKENVSWLRSKTVVHFSGSLTLKGVHGFHPLMTFTSELYDLETYKKIVFIGEKEGPDFKKIFPNLENKYFVIPKESKDLYHALCVMAGNFSVILWQNLFNELSRRWDIPRNTAFPYLEQITKNLLQTPDLALTGPLQRRDFGTIEKNREALKRTYPDNRLLKIYDAFVETCQ